MLDARTKFTEAQRCKIAADVYAEVLNNTETFAGAIGRDLAYLLGAIVRNQSCEWRAGHVILTKLEPLGKGHAVWRFIDILPNRGAE